MKHFYTFLLALLISSIAFGQTEIFNESGGGTAPSGWTFTDNDTSEPIDKGSYWLLDSGNPSDIITTTSFDLSSYLNAEFTMNIRSFGSGSHNEAKIEISYDGGSSFTQTVNTQITTTSYQSIGTINLNSISNQVVLRISNNGNSGRGVRMQNLVLTASGSATNTSVEFLSTSNSVSEGIGTTDLTFSITNEDALATTFDVVITAGDGDASDINGYTTQMVTFASNSSTDETLTITVTDDMIFEGDETITFSIQNVSGGNNASVGANSSFDLTIIENDLAPPLAPVWCEPFNNNSQFSVTLGGEGSDGSQDYFHITDGSNINKSYSNTNGTFFAGQDIDDTGWAGSDSPSQLTWTGINIGAFSSLRFTGSFASVGGGIDASDSIVIEYQIDSGGWQDLLAFENTGGFNNNFLEDTDFNGTGDGTALTNTFTEFEKSIGSTGTLIDLRITISLDSGDEDIAFDDFKLEGIYNGLTYIDGAWSPSAPDGSTGSDNALIVNGKYDVTSSVVLNDVFVNPGAAIEVTASGTLEAGSLNLDSSSSQYSSLILDGTLAGNIAAGGGNVTYRRHVNNYNGGASGGNDLVASPLTGLIFFDFATDPDNANLYENPTPANDDQREYLFGPFDNGDSLEYLSYSIGLDAPFGNPDPSNTDYNSDEPLTTGKGFRAATIGSTGRTLTFRGGVNTGAVTTGDFSAPGIDPIDKWNLVGNPYPSYLNAQTFLSTNSGVIDSNFNAIYGYNDSTDGSASGIWTIINNVQNNGINITPGQGFFVASNNTGELSFTAAMRLATGGDDFIQGRETTVTTHLGLTLSNDNSNSYNTDFYFTTNATAGLNSGYDAGLFGGTATSFSLYSHLVQDNQGVPFAIQALGETDYNDITIPLGVNANQGEQITFSINDNTLPNTVNVYLEDNETNTVTLLNNGNYVLTPNTNINGTGRFFLNFSADALSTQENVFDNLNIYTDNANKTVVIVGELQETTTAKVFDLQGRIVSINELDISKRRQSIDTSNLSTGVYIVQLNNKIQSKSQKVIIR